MAITDFDRWIDAYEEAKPQRSTATTTPSRAGAIDALQDHSADDVARCRNWTVSGWCVICTESTALMLTGDIVHVLEDRSFGNTGELYRLR